MSNDPSEPKISKTAWRESIVVSIRNEVRSSVYRAALRNHLGCAYGFLLGTDTPFDSPTIEFALNSAAPTSMDDLWPALEHLKIQLQAAEQAAKYAGVKVIGAFIAHDTSFGERRHQLTGCWVENAVAMKLPYLIAFPTMGFETLWAPKPYHAATFPHNELSYITARGKLSIQPRHNPRRVRALWHRLFAEGMTEDGENTNAAVVP